VVEVKATRLADWARTGKPERQTAGQVAKAIQQAAMLPPVATIQRMLPIQPVQPTHATANGNGAGRQGRSPIK
jgi:hypothetical protein